MGTMQAPSFWTAKKTASQRGEFGEHDAHVIARAHAEGQEAVGDAIHPGVERAQS